MPCLGQLYKKGGRIQNLLVRFNSIEPAARTVGEQLMPRPCMAPNSDLPRHTVQRTTYTAWSVEDRAHGIVYATEFYPTDLTVNKRTGTWLSRIQPAHQEFRCRNSPTPKNNTNLIKAAQRTVDVYGCSSAHAHCTGTERGAFSIHQNELPRRTCCE